MVIIVVVVVVGSFIERVICGFNSEVLGEGVFGEEGESE